jgi:hypothetical protein
MACPGSTPWGKTLPDTKRLRGVNTPWGPCGVKESVLICNPAGIQLNSGCICTRFTCHKHQAKSGYGTKSRFGDEGFLFVRNHDAGMDGLAECPA